VGDAARRRRGRKQSDVPRAGGPWCSATISGLGMVVGSSRAGGAASGRAALCSKRPALAGTFLTPLRLPSFSPQNPAGQPFAGAPSIAHRITGALFLLQSGNDPVRSQPQEPAGCNKAKPIEQAKRRGAAVNCAGAERAQWAMQRGGGGPGNRAMCRGPVARGAARQFPGSEWSLVRAGQEEPRRAACSLKKQPNKKRTGQRTAGTLFIMCSASAFRKGHEGESCFSGFACFHTWPGRRPDAAPRNPAAPAAKAPRRCWL